MQPLVNETVVGLDAEAAAEIAEIKLEALHGTAAACALRVKARLARMPTSSAMTAKARARGLRLAWFACLAASRFPYVMRDDIHELCV